MYFLSPEEYKYVTRKLLMDARRDEVHPDLRGWNWSQPPIVTNAKVRLGVSDIASLYCSTGKDLYLKKVSKVGFRANEAMIEGLFLHRVISEVFTKAKIILFGNYKISSKDFLNEIGEFDTDRYLSEWGFSTDPTVTTRPFVNTPMIEKAKLLWEFERARVAFRVDDIRSRYPYCEADAFVFLVLPVVVEQRLNGAFLGLSQNLAVDGYLVNQGMVLDLKFDPKERDFHKLTTTGYAMVMESLYEYPVDLGCIVYVKFKDKQIQIKKEFHHINDELRQWFLEERDRKIRIVQDEFDPGMSEECYAECPYRSFCYQT